MPFPLHYRAEIQRPGIDSNKDHFLTLMPGELRGIGLQGVLVNGDRISFGRGTSRYFSQWNLLTALDGGDINVLTEGGTMTVRYELNFTTFVVVMVSFFVLGSIVWAIVVHPSTQMLLVTSLFLLVWLVAMVLSCWQAARKLGGIINRTLARSD
jgi:hypothetical protein